MSIILAILGTVTAASVIALTAKLAHSAGAGTKLANAVQSMPAVDLHTKSATFNAAVDAAGNSVETVLKNTLTGDALQAFLAFLATSPSEAQVLTYVEENFGGKVLSQCEAALPELLKQELTILGHSLPGILGSLVAKAAPSIAVSAAAATVEAAQHAQTLKTIATLADGSKLVKPAAQAG